MAEIAHSFRKAYS